MIGASHDEMTAVDGLSKGTPVEGRLIERHLVNGEMTRGHSVRRRTIEEDLGNRCTTQAKEGEVHQGTTAADAVAAVAANHN